eukprot:1056258-Lingulodinium_polyedra.AAC.1
MCIRDRPCPLCTTVPVQLLNSSSAIEAAGPQSAMPGRVLQKLFNAWGSGGALNFWPRRRGRR